MVILFCPYYIVVLLLHKRVPRTLSGFVAGVVSYLPVAAAWAVPKGWIPAVVPKEKVNESPLFIGLRFIDILLTLLGKNPHTH